MHRTILLVLAGCAPALVAACDQPASPGADAAASRGASPSPATSQAPSVDLADAARVPDAPAGWDAAMPPRPVPRTSPTVGAGMPAEVQMEAIAYMAAMGAPRYDDPAADAQWAADLAEKLRPITRSLDKGAAPDKEKLDRVEVGSGGRRVDMMMAAGCDAETPMRAVVTRGGQPLTTLFAHGVLVVRCNDARVQCLQSTRDPTDVLCTTAPRHR